MESTDGIKRLGDKELELLILRHISENDGAKESEICRAIPARNARIVGYLTHYTGIGVLEMRFSDVSYTSKLYSLTELGEFILCLKVIDCSTVRGNLKVAECGEPDFGGENLRTLTRRLRRLCAERSDRWDIGPRRPLASGSACGPAGRRGTANRPERTVTSLSFNIL